MNSPKLLVLLSFVFLLQHSAEPMISAMYYKLNYIDTNNLQHLRKAAQENDLKTLDLFLTDKKNIKEQGPKSLLPSASPFEMVTVLHVACEYGNYQFALKLLEAGALVNILDDEGNSPLHKAFLARRKNIPQHIEITKSIGPNVFHTYYLSVDLEIEDKYFFLIQLLIKYGANIYKPFGELSWDNSMLNGVNNVTPLEYAAETGQMDLVKLLLFVDLDYKMKRNFLNKNIGCGALSVKKTRFFPSLGILQSRNI